MGDDERRSRSATGESNQARTVGSAVRTGASESVARAMRAGSVILVRSRCGVKSYAGRTLGELRKLCERHLRRRHTCQGIGEMIEHGVRVTR